MTKHSRQSLRESHSQQISFFLTASCIFQIPCFIAKSVLPHPHPVGVGLLLLLLFGADVIKLVSEDVVDASSSPFRPIQELTECKGS